MFNKFCQLLFTLILSQSLNTVNCELKVSARCGRPGLPTGASLHHVSKERGRFDNKEKVVVICKPGGFSHHKQELTCLNGRWIGNKARCGKHTDAQVVQLDVYDCNSSDNRHLFSQNIKQEIEPKLPPNSFHVNRHPRNISISSDESSCYDFKIQFERKVQIWFLLIDIFHPLVKGKTEIPTLEPIVSKHRNCTLQHINKKSITEYEVIGYYYFCDLNSESDARNENLDPNDTIMVRINSSLKEEIGLEAMFIGDVYKSDSGASAKLDCGSNQVENTGIDVQSDSPLFYENIFCNDSFVDISDGKLEKESSGENPKHIYTCGINGQWVGKWPVCKPIKSCSKEEIIDGKSDSVNIEEIGNVFYVNESQWFAINDSWVRYTCNRDNNILIGKHMIICLANGSWSNKAPECKGTSVGISGFAISGILFAVLLVFVLIVLIVFRMHSKRVKRELRETRNEIQETRHKRVSDELYADVSNDYDTTDHCKNTEYTSLNYDSIKLEPRYCQNKPEVNRILFPEYEDMRRLK